MTDNLYADSHRDFLGYAKHLDGVTVLHEDGLYRHIQFGARGAVGWFELTTWPNRLAITGDIGGWVFGKSAEDMFELFARRDGDISPDYWQEKVVAGAPVKEFSEDGFTRQVVEDFWQRRHEFAGERRALFREIREDVLEFVEHEHEARSNLESFRYTPKNGGRAFIYRDSWEWNLTDWSPHYLRACHAVVWGINRYRQAVKS